MESEKQKKSHLFINNVERSIERKSSTPYVRTKTGITHCEHLYARNYTDF